ncbi:thioesterase domain-containing protein, partial [Marinibactrum halimedae]
LGLEADQIGVKDNFFELGGHSLLAVQLMAKINGQFAQSLPLAILFSHSTIASLAKLMSSGDKLNTFEIVVPLQTKGQRRPIFAVPGVGGNVLSFQPLAKALEGKAHLYGLQAAGLDGKATPFSSVEETAHANIQAMRSVQSSGPYRLMGHSYGGVVAFEMARILIQEGQQIESLTLLDSFVPSVLEGLQRTDETTMLIDVCHALAELYGVTLTLDMDQLHQVSQENMSGYVSEYFDGLGIAISKEQFSTFFRVYQASLENYRAYNPSVLTADIDVSLYRAVKNKSAIENLPKDHGWNPLLLSSITIHDVGAGHFTMLEKNHNQQIVDRLVDTFFFENNTFDIPSREDTVLSE